MEAWNIVAGKNFVRSMWLMWEGNVEHRNDFSVDWTSGKICGEGGVQDDT